MKKISILFIAIILSIMIIGCKNNRHQKEKFLYNAEIVDSGPISNFIFEHPITNFNASFLSENKVGGIRYINEEYDPSKAGSEKYIFNSTSPKEIIKVIDSEDF